MGLLNYLVRFCLGILLTLKTAHCQTPSSSPSPSEAVVKSLRLERVSSKFTYNEDLSGYGYIIVYDKYPFTLDMFGDNLEDVRKVKFTTANNSLGESCTGDDGHYQSEEILPTVVENGTYQIQLSNGLAYQENDDVYYLCIQLKEGRGFIHQGDSRSVRVHVTKELLPDWLKISIIAVCLVLSGIFSGLNLGLMSLDQTELQIVKNCGSKKEKRYAEKILPVRKHGNFLLCSILLGNVLVNNSMTITLDTMIGGGGVAAVAFSTIAIVIFGEILPQAICSRHGLAIGAYTIWLMKLFMLLTSPLSFPLSKLLDFFLGSEIGTVYDKQKLMELIKVTENYTDLQKDEVNMVTGALVLSKKNVKDVMTRIEDCYMLPLDRVLDFATVSEIKSQGYSRIPVYDRERTNVVYILFAKDLLFLDTDDEKTVEEVCKFYRNDPNFVYDDTVLTDMFNEFKTGDKGHMAIVQTTNNEGEGDPYLETIGLVTLEDIIEEIVQAEIVDETDIIIDNKSKKKRKNRKNKEADLRLFGHKSQHHVSISPQMLLAVLQYLTTSVRPFYPENFSLRILQKLLSMDVYREIKLKRPGDKDEGIIMRKGVPCDFFVLVIEGRVEVTIGKEEKVFHEGPFSCFGEQMLEMELRSSQSFGSFTSERSTGSSQSKTMVPWVPDYKLRAITDLVYLKIRRGIYQMAVKANRLNSLNSESESNLREQDLVETLTKVTKSDADYDVSMSIMEDHEHPPEKLRSDNMSLPELKLNNSYRALSRASTISMERRSQPAPSIENLVDSVLVTPERANSKVVFMISQSESEGGARRNLSDIEWMSPEATSLLQSQQKVS